MRDAEQEDYFKSLTPIWADLPHSRGKVDPKGPDGGPRDANRATRPSLATRQLARKLRRSQTFTEQVLWSMLRKRAIDGLRFRRQASIGRYVADFLCIEKRLIVELDGGVHEAEFYDVARAEAREAWLKQQGYRVLRVRAADVANRAPDVLAAIRTLANGGAAPHPAPSGPPSPASGEGNYGGSFLASEP